MNRQRKRLGRAWRRLSELLCRHEFRRIGGRPTEPGKWRWVEGCIHCTAHREIELDYPWDAPPPKG